MAVTYLHGLETLELADGLRPIQTVKSSVIGLIGTAPEADADTFPLNTPVALFADPSKALKLGKTGTLYDAINAIYTQGSAVVVVVRVAEGANADATLKKNETWSNVVGSVAAKTGVWAFLSSRSLLRVVPKILIAPGLTSEMPVSGVASFTVGTAGTGYTTAPVVTIGAPPAGGRQATAVAIVTGGAVTGLTVTDPGFGYLTAPTVTFGGPGASAAATAVLGTVANPVAVALGSITARLRAFALVDGPGTNYNAAVAYRATLSNPRVMVIDPGTLVWNTTDSEYVAAPGSAFAAGLQARVDVEQGFWFPFSNYPILGIGGSSRPIDFMPNDSNSEANQLNAAQVTTIIHEDGFRFWGLRSTGSDPLWAFMNVRRTADMIYESVERAHRDVLDKPFSFQLLDSIQSSVNAYLRTLKGRGALIGGECWIDPYINTPASFVNGELTVDFDLEPPAPLEKLQFRVRRNPQYYQDFIEDFTARVIAGDQNA